MPHAAAREERPAGALNQRKTIDLLVTLITLISPLDQSRQQIICKQPLRVHWSSLGDVTHASWVVQ